MTALEQTPPTPAEAPKPSPASAEAPSPAEAPKPGLAPAEAPKPSPTPAEAPSPALIIEAAPVAEKTPAQASDEGAKPAPKPHTGKKVLIVEDTIELAEVIQATLERMGLATLHETHAIKALELFKVYKPDLVMLDIGLPDMSGWKLLDSIKEIDKANRPHIVVITAYGDPANRLMGKLQDVDSYLIKPFSPDDAERVVEKVLGLTAN